MKLVSNNSDEDLEKTKSARAALNWDTLAEKSGVGKRTIIDFENGGSAGIRFQDVTASSDNGVIE
jgi:DNA-binding XRE family transcriptional regulator